MGVIFHPTYPSIYINIVICFYQQNLESVLKI
jgi:hypothetical protein